MDSIAHDSLITGVEWSLALGLLSGLASWGFYAFARMFERAAR